MSSYWFPVPRSQYMEQKLHKTWKKPVSINSSCCGIVVVLGSSRTMFICSQIPSVLWKMGWNEFSISFLFLWRMSRTFLMRATADTISGISIQIHGLNHSIIESGNTMLQILSITTVSSRNAMLWRKSFTLHENADSPEVVSSNSSNVAIREKKNFR